MLVDGRLQATWAARRDGVLTVRPSLPLAAAARAEVEEEGARLLGFLAPGGDPDVRFEGR